MKAARDQGNKASLRYNKLKINGVIYILDQLKEIEDRNGIEVADHWSKVYASKRTVCERSPNEKGKTEEQEKTYIMIRKITNNSRTSINHK